MTWIFVKFFSYLALWILTGMNRQKIRMQMRYCIVCTRKVCYGLMCGSCHIRSSLIGVEYWNWTLDVYLLFSCSAWTIYQKLNLRLETYKLACPYVSYKYVNQFRLNLPCLEVSPSSCPNTKKQQNIQSSTTIFDDN